MFDRILESIAIDPPTRITTIKTGNYIKDLITRRDSILMRTDEIVGSQHDGFELLKVILANADINTLLTISSDLDRYTDHVKPRLDELNRLFDPVMRGVPSQSVFLDRTNRDAQEYIFPVHTISDLKYLPLDKGWDVWQTYRPLRFIYADSREMTMNIYTGGIVFKKDPPTIGVFTLNVPALVLQYARYITDVPEKDRVPIDTYLNTYVLKNGLLTDLINNWLKLTYLNVMSYPDLDDADRRAVNETLTNNVYGYIGSQYIGAMADIRELVSMAQNKRVLPDRFLASLPLIGGDVSALYDASQTHIQMLDVRQYEWAMFMRDYLTLRLLIGAHALAPTSAQSVNFGRRVVRDMNLIARTRFWKSAVNRDTQDTVEIHFDALRQLVHASWG